MGEWGCGWFLGLVVGDNWRIRRWISVPPVDHSCVGRNLIFMCRQRRCLLGGDAALGCEIPAFAGMVCGGRECVGVFWHCVVFRLRRILRGVAACNVRFLPSQEWSVGVRECGRILALLSAAAIVAAVALLGRINGDGSRQKLNAKLRNKKVFSKYY